MNVTGTIEYIGQPVQKSPTFTTCELWLTTDEQYPQTLNIQFVNDKINLLNNFQIGQTVSIGINLRGNKFQDQQTGVWKCFNTVQGWKIEPAQIHSAVNQQQGYQQPTQPQTQQGYGQPQQYQGWSPTNNNGNHQQ